MNEVSHIVVCEIWINKAVNHKFIGWTKIYGKRMCVGRGWDVVGSMKYETDWIHWLNKMGMAKDTLTYTYKWFQSVPINSLIPFISFQDKQHRYEWTYKSVLSCKEWRGMVPRSEVSGKVGSSDGRDLTAFLSENVVSQSSRMEGHPSGIGISRWSVRVCLCSVFVAAVIRRWALAAQPVSYE